MKNETSMELLHAFNKAAYNKEYYQKNKQYWREYYNVGKNRGVTGNQASDDDWKHKQKKEETDADVVYNAIKQHHVTNDQIAEATRNARAKARENLPKNASDDDVEKEAIRLMADEIRRSEGRQTSKTTTSAKSANGGKRTKEQADQDKVNGMSKNEKYKYNAAKEFMEKVNSRKKSPASLTTFVANAAKKAINTATPPSVRNRENKTSMAENKKRMLASNNGMATVAWGIDRILKDPKSLKNVTVRTINAMNANKELANLAYKKAKKEAAKKRKNRDNINQGISNSMAERMKQQAKDKNSAYKKNTVAKSAVQSSVSNSMAERMRQAARDKATMYATKARRR